MRHLIIIFISLTLITSCVDSLDDYNIDQKRPSTAPAETFLTASVKLLSDLIATPNVNVNNFRLYTQQWATTTYLQEPRYDLTSRIIPQNIWQALYKDVIADLREARRLTEEDDLVATADKTAMLAQLEVVEVYTWFVLVTTFGDAPYSQSMDYRNPVPVYDDDETIYADILIRLDDAIASLTSGGNGFDNADVMYDGDLDQWIKFANSLKLKLGMLLADVDNAKAKQIVEAAAANVFTSNDDNARFPYLSSPPNNNPLSANLNPAFSSRQDYVVASTITDKMNALNDPRRPFYFTTVNGEYKGGNYGFANAYGDFSHTSNKTIAADFEALFLDYSEVEFLLAEAVERGFAVGGTAEEHYNKAIEASIVYWGGSVADATTYRNQASVKYTSAAGTYKEKIGLQKWIALYNRGIDAWTEWRRLDYPVLVPPSGGNVPVGLTIPVRIIYPINEQTLNGINRQAAADGMGGDLATSKLFWDVK